MMKFLVLALVLFIISSLVLTGCLMGDMDTSDDPVIICLVFNVMLVSCVILSLAFFGAARLIDGIL